ncbi:MAG: chromate efflux transporter [Desulfobacterales bacterium]
MKFKKAANSVATDSGTSELSLTSMVSVFLKLGAIGFGGGMAVIALMEHEFVAKRQEFTAEEFLHGVGLAQILGPFAPNTAFFLGYRRYGLPGAVLSVIAFLLPSVTMVILLSSLYFRYHTIPALQGVLAGVGPIVIALILSAAWSMGRKSMTGWLAIAFALAGGIAGTFKINPIWVLLSAGIIGLLIGRKRMKPNVDQKNTDTGSNLKNEDHPKTGIMASAALPLAASSTAASLSTLGLAFLKIGLVFFGGGFVLIPILHQRIVEYFHWLTPREFIDGVAISNLTPGPIAVPATFTGYRLQGIPGAVLATVALFTPAMILMAIISIGYEYFKGSSRAQDFLSGVAPTVVGLVASAAFLLWRSAIPSWRMLLLMVAALALLIRFKWHPAFVLALGAGLAAIGAVP